MKKICIAVLFFSASLSLFGHMVMKLSDLHTMAQNSDCVIHGRVGDQRVEIGKFGRLVTLTEVEIIDPLRSDKKAGGIFTIYQVGGELFDGKNRIVMPIVGGQRYNPGQEIMFFGLKLEKNFVSFGMGQGKFDIFRDEKEETIIEDLGDIEVMGLKNQIKGKNPLSYSDLELFKMEIRLMLENKRKDG